MDAEDTKKDERVRLVILINPVLNDRLEEACKISGMHMSELVRAGIDLKILDIKNNLQD